MCFSAAANFVGSGVLGTVGVATLTEVKHRRELLFATLPVLFAVYHFIKGFVWLGLDGILSPAVAHDMGAAFMLYAQGLLPFLLPREISRARTSPGKGQLQTSQRLSRASAESQRDLVSVLRAMPVATLVDPILRLPWRDRWLSGVAIGSPSADSLLRPIAPQLIIKFPCAS